MANRRILVTGGTGFVGRSVLRELKNRGEEVVCLARPCSDVDEIERLGFKVVRGTIAEDRALEAAIDGIRAVIHLVGIIQPYRENTFERVHVEGTANVVRWAKRAGVERFIHMSALGTRPDGRSRYHKTKWAAEEIVRGSGLDFTIFRPSIMYGEHCPFLDILRDLIAKPLVTPVAGRGKNLLQPVYVGDVARCFVDALTDPRCANRVFDLGGPTPLTMDELVDLLTVASGRRRKPKMHIPGYLLWLPALFMELVHHRPPFTRDQLTMLKEDNVCDMTATRDVFPGEFVPFEAWINS